MSDYESEEENIDRSTQPMGYLYEPEYTDEEMCQIALQRAERERVDREVEVEAGATAGVARSRVTDNWWCTCFKCEIMPTEVECYCCHEWELIMPQMQDLSIHEDVDVPAQVCIINHHVLPALLNAGVLQTFFHYRLIAYRIVMEWALKGEKLGAGNRRVLPSCVVELIRKTYPSPNGQYAGVQRRTYCFIQ
uniref:P2X purinoreceptor 7 intracellular domain-containing protein n=1 Tax=Amphiprion ocellaris TaxID=80972 RepID=A0AAQ5XKR1_AMPOC